MTTILIILGIIVALIFGFLALVIILICKGFDNREEEVKKLFEERKMQNNYQL